MASSKKSKLRKDAEQLAKSSKALKKTVTKIVKVVKKVTKSKPSKKQVTNSSPKKGGTKAKSSKAAGSKATSSKQTKIATKSKSKSPEKRVSKPTKKTTAPKKQTAKELSSRRSYSLRDLTSQQQDTVIDSLMDIERHGQELRDVMRPGEKLGFRLYGNRSIQLYDDPELAASSLAKYVNISDFNDDLDSVVFVKFGEPQPDEITEEQENRLLDSYKAERAKETKARKEREAEEGQRAGKMIEQATGKKGTKNARGLVSGLLSVNEALQKQVEAMNAQLAKLQKEMAKLAGTKVSRKQKPSGDKAKKPNKQQNTQGKHAKGKNTANSAKRGKAAPAKSKKPVAKKQSTKPKSKKTTKKKKG